MARIMRWTGRGLLGLLLLLLLGSAGLVLWLRTSLPQVEGERVIAAATAPVTIARDDRGVPHIRAESLNDAYMAVGFLHAQDRLFQMEAMRRAGRGRMAELVGDLAVGIDKRMRTFGLARLVDADVAKLPLPVRVALQAYTDGINAFLETRSGALPPEFLLVPGEVEPWKPADSLLWIKLMSLRLTSDWSDEIERAALASRLTPEQVQDMYPAEEGPITLGKLPEQLPGGDAIRHALDAARVVEEGAGSNLWLYAGRLTDTGKPILANDPHLGFNVPSTWYLVRIETPHITLAGATSPGFPFVVLGHNGKVAWAITNAYGDTSDVFVEKTDPADPGRYLTPDGSAAFKSSQETIQVRFGDPLNLTIRRTRHGPVISDGMDRAEDAGAPDDGYAYALSHTALRPGDTTAAALWHVQRAASVTDAIEATRAAVAPQQNIALADVNGTTGLISPALVPIRRSPPQMLPAPGWTGEHDWTGFIPFEGLPQIVNPPSGRLVNANNRLTGPDYPYDLGHGWSSPMRAEAIEQALDARVPHTVQASLDVQRDLHSLAARRLLDAVDWRQAGDGVPADLLQAMQTWDAVMAADRPEPLFFHAWLRALNHGLFADELGPLFDDHQRGNIERVLHMLTAAPEWCDVTGTPGRETCPQITAAAFNEAYTEMTARFGDDWRAWRWDAAHVARFRHVPFGYIPVLKDLFDVSVPHDGGRYTSNAGIVSFKDGNLFNQVHGAGFRAVYDLADLNRSRFIQSVGQSGNIFSENYGDMAPIWKVGGTVSLGPLQGEPASLMTLVPE